MTVALDADKIAGHLEMFTKFPPADLALCVKLCPVCREMAAALWSLSHFATGGIRV